MKTQFPSTPQTTLLMPPNRRIEGVVKELESQPQDQETVILGGATSGKVAAALEFAKNSGRPTALTRFHSSDSQQTVAGTYVIGEQGFELKKPHFVEVAEQNGVIILEDPNLTSRETQEALAELVTSNPGAKFIAVMEPSQYVGRRLMEPSLTEALGYQEPGNLVFKGDNPVQTGASAEAELLGAIRKSFPDIPEEPARSFAAVFEALRTAQESRLVPSSKESEHRYDLQGLVKAGKAASLAIKGGEEASEACKAALQSVTHEKDLETLKCLSRVHFG